VCVSVCLSVAGQLLDEIYSNRQAKGEGGTCIEKRGLV
jgi:hypothetical protein